MKVGDLAVFVEADVMPKPEGWGKTRSARPGDVCMVIDCAFTGIMQYYVVLIGGETWAVSRTRERLKALQ